MSERKTILVTGATGAQGGSVARHLLRGGRFAVRALTRNPASDRADALKAAGAEVVAGDMEDVESLKRALDGAYGAFGVTNFWEHFAKERQHGLNLIDAVSASGVEHFVFSTLPSAAKASGGELSAPHLDIKAELEEYSRQRVPGSTYVSVAFYYENFLSFFPPQKQDDGSYTFGFPQGDTPLAAVAVEDTGGVVAPIFENPEKYRDRVVGIVGDDLPVSRYAETLTEVLGVPVRYQHIPREVFASFGFPGADDLADMFDYNRRFVPTRQADIEECRCLYPPMQTFATWARAQASPLKAAFGL